MRVHDGRIVKLDVEEVHLPNGNVVTLEIVRHRGAAAVVPVDDEGRAVLVRQYRHATKGYLLEVPAGTLDPGEAPEACALREVGEETGLRAERLDPLGFIWTTPGFTDERIWLYRATGLTETAVAHESDEIITVERLPLDEAVRRALAGDITDAKSVCALLRASNRRE
ncbi:MAG TPA: NUDIX hydrolase [Candidatus Polarisedimenticolaceae bacterium]|nr:NUDIX hydrolase [Candidatus Polarisedimenticolaceae bacterium]